MTLLPARPIPYDGEAFSSWLHRLSWLSGMTKQALTGSQARFPTPDSLERLSALTGLTADQIDAMSWRRWPARMTGRGSSNQRWLLDRTWTCPTCAPQQHMWLKAWEIATSPCCLTCATLLVDPLEPIAQPITAPDALLDVCAWLSDIVAAAPEDRRAAATLTRLHRLCCMVAATIDSQWPPRQVTLIEDYGPCRAWSGQPPTQPAAVAEVLLATIPHHRRGQSTALVATGRSRVAELAPTSTRPSKHQLPTQRRRTDPPALKPYTPTVTPISEAGRDRYARMARKAPTMVTADQIPALLPLPGDGFLPDPDQWAYRNDLAKALNMILRIDDGGRPGQLVDAHNHFGEPNAAPSLLLRDLARGYLAPKASRDLDQALPLLTDMPNLTARRSLLHQHHALPASWNRIVPASIDPALSHGWIWCYLTGGDLRGAPWWAKPDGWFPSRTIWDFHHSLDAHTLLAMAHAADDYINPALDDLLRDTTRTPAAVLGVLA